MTEGSNSLSCALPENACFNTYFIKAVIRILCTIIIIIEFTLSSPKADKRPAPYAFIESPSLHSPNSTENQYSYNKIKNKNFIICNIVQYNKYLLFLQ